MNKRVPKMSSDPKQSFAFIFAVVIARKADWYILQLFYIWSRCPILRSINGPFGNFFFNISASATTLALAFVSVLQKNCWKNRIFMIFLVLTHLTSISPWNTVPLCYKCLFLHPSISYLSTMSVHCCSRIKTVWFFGSTCPLAFRKNSAPKTFESEPVNRSWLTPC